MKKKFPPSPLIFSPGGGEGRVRGRFLLFFILVLGFGLRMWGIGFGLPDLYHADEPALVLHALAHGTGDLNPHYFKLPAFLNYYLCTWFGIYFVFGKITGWFPTLEAFIVHFLEDPTAIYLIGRAVTGLCGGVLGVYLIYRLGLLVTSTSKAILAAFFLSVCFLHVRDSHYVIYDIPLTTALTACLIVLSLLTEKGKLRDYMAFGILAGLTTAIKYNGALILAPFLLAHWLRLQAQKAPWREILFHRSLWAGLFFTLMGYAMGSPFSLIDFKTFWPDFWIQARSEGSWGFFHHLQYSLREGMGVPLLTAGLGGILLFLFSDSGSKKVIASFVILWLIYLGLYSQPYERYALPVTPFLCLGASELVGTTLDRLRLNHRIAWGFTGVVIVAIPFSYSLYSDYLFAQKDVRTMAREWVERNIPSGSKIALDYPFYQPRLRFTKGQLIEKRELIRGSHSELQSLRLKILLKNFDEAKPNYQLFFLDEGDPEKRPLFSRPTIPFAWEALQKKRIGYLLITRLSSQYEKPEFYERVRKEGRLIQRLSPYRDLSITQGLARFRQTAAATEGTDLFARIRFGDIIEIYQIGR